MRQFIIILLFIIHSLAYPGQQFFKTTTSLPIGRQMYGTVSVGQYLYVIGGNLDPDVYTCSVIKARINEDGTLGAWEETTPLYAPRSYINNTTLSLNNYIYVAQGLNGNSSLKYRTITWSKAGEDGNLEPWQESIPCPGEGVSCSVAVATPGFIHLIGGSMGQSQPIPNVWSAQVGADGAIVAWEQGPTLPVPLWFHCGGLADGKVWVWSGLLGSSSSAMNTGIYYAPVEPSGRLGTWQDSGSELPRGFYSSSCTVTGDYLLSFCPRYAHGELCGDVWFAVAGPQGLSEWQIARCELPAKHYIGVATSYLLGYVYLPGGRLNKENLEFDKTVYYFSIVSQEEVKKQQNTQANSQAYSNSAYTAASTVSREVSTAMPNQTGMNQPQSTASSQKFPGFSSYEDIKQQYFSRPRPTVIYFHSDTIQDCQMQAQILGGFQPQTYMDKIIFGEVNAAMYPAVASQYKVAKVPYWFFYDASGNLLNQKDGILQLNELSQFLRVIAP